MNNAQEKWKMEAGELCSLSCVPSAVLGAGVHTLVFQDVLVGEGGSRTTAQLQCNVVRDKLTGEWPGERIRPQELTCEGEEIAQEIPCEKEELFQAKRWTWD